jgi:NADH:ubiquinone oxidoreductase subunit H
MLKIIVMGCVLAAVAITLKVRIATAAAAARSGDRDYAPAKFTGRPGPALIGVQPLPTALASIIRPARDDDILSAFRRRCSFATVAPTLQMVSPLLAHTNSQGRPRTV